MFCFLSFFDYIELARTNQVKSSDCIVEMSRVYCGIYTLCSHLKLESRAGHALAGGCF